MRLWMIRHAIAEEAETFSGPDLERPLTPEGRRQAQAAFLRLARLRAGPDIVISSEAVRAWETAKILCLAYGITRHERTPLLNPGCRFKDIKKVVADLPARTRHAALVGHEPDFSNAISRWTSDGHLALAMKKNAVVELEFHKDGSVELIMAVPPDILAGG